MYDYEPGTGSITWDDDGGTGVEVCYSTSSCDDYELPEDFFEELQWRAWAKKEWVFLKSAFDLKAIHKIKSSAKFIASMPGALNRRLLFSKSGYLPSKVRKIKKGA